MWSLLTLKRLVVRHFAELSWLGLFFALLAYIAITFLLLSIAGEQDLIAKENFIYWLLVTASTVGYGDLSPSTTQGKWIVSIFVIPFGLGLFGLVIGRVAVFTSNQWKKGARGLKRVNTQDHILVIGWDEQRTLKLLRLLVREAQGNRQRPIVLCTTEDIENPLPDDIKFSRVNSFTDDQEMNRAGVLQASSIIINTQSDELTMTTALYCYGRNADAHLIAYFANEALSRLLKVHCPRVECTPSVAIEMQVKACMDPGSSSLHQELLNADKGMTQYSFTYPDDQRAVTVGTLFQRLKETYNATLIGLSEMNSESISVNPVLDTKVEPNSRIYYIADERIHNLDWNELSA